LFAAVLAPSGIVTVNIGEHMSNRSQERNDRDILRLKSATGRIMLSSC
jgi:hypothetical protein